MTTCTNPTRTDEGVRHGSQLLDDVLKVLAAETILPVSRAEAVYIATGSATTEQMRWITTAAATRLQRICDALNSIAHDLHWSNETVLADRITALADTIGGQQ